MAKCVLLSPRRPVNISKKPFSEYKEYATCTCRTHQLHKENYEMDKYWVLLAVEKQKTLLRILVLLVKSAQLAVCPICPGEVTIFNLIS